MGKRLLLDCTLRDGGYVNDWDFGHDDIIKIYERLCLAGVDMIEIGFLDERRPYDRNRSILPDTASVRTTFGMAEGRPPMVVGMIDYGTCPVECIEDCKDSFIDGIRVIFKKQKMHEAMEFCGKLKEKGYKVFSQLVSITAYSDEDLNVVIGLVNQVKPFAVSMVDTYGLLDPVWLMHYYEQLDEKVDKEIAIGFHAHNNFQLAYANAMTFLKKDRERDILVDGTLFGMGKSAGNAPLELLAMHMNENYGKSYDVSQMLEAIEENIRPFYAKSPWGYKTFFYLSASNKCHPGYVDYFQSKGNLSITKLNKLLAMIQPEEKKLLYDKDLAESIYRKYVNEDLDDEDSLKKLKKICAGKEVLLIGPGKNIRLQSDKVERFLKEHDCVSISFNYIPENIKPDYVFITKAGRYHELTGILHENPDIGVIATTNLEPLSKAFDMSFGREGLLELKEAITDNPFLMMLKILRRADIRKVNCAGMDGYSDNEENYVNPGMEYDFVKAEAQHLNRYIRDELAGNYSDMEIEFITFSHYNKTEDIDSGSF
ncbi:MAG: aldolase catalytic domain-containing protein [Lachnospiraceae bacterium]|nr:aldolase catalytic domain-containing protein [Lachnospiraceae bacterium]